LQAKKVAQTSVCGVPQRKYGCLFRLAIVHLSTKVLTRQKPHSQEWLCYSFVYFAGACALKSAVREMSTIHRPFRLAITQLA
jgi:hypothetical protein